MERLFWLSDGEWAKIEPLLPRGRRGAHWVDDRRVISGIMHMLHSGARWRDCPAGYGPYTTIYNRFNRWSRQGLWTGIFYALTGSTGMSGTMAIDSKTQRRIVSAWIGTAFAQDDAAAARKQWRQVADQARPRVPKLEASGAAGGAQFVRGQGGTSAFSWRTRLD